MSQTASFVLSKKALLRLPRLLTHACNAQRQILHWQKLSKVQTNHWIGTAAVLRCHPGCTCYTAPLAQDQSSACIPPWALHPAGLLCNFSEWAAQQRCCKENIISGNFSAFTTLFSGQCEGTTSQTCWGAASMWCHLWTACGRDACMSSWHVGLPRDLTWCQNK